MNATRHPFIDALKIAASQFIVWHHLSAYGPLSDALHRALPATMDWLFGYGRMAVQVFLVLAGYLAIQGLMARMQGPAPVLLKAVSQRYRRLLPPFAIAMALAIAASTMARPWLGIDLAGSPPGLAQMLAHTALLHEVLGMESFSAGVWYVAIDFQLYTLMALLTWVGLRRGQQRTAWALIALASTASLLWWNRIPGFDDWALYFLGAYGLGAIVFGLKQLPSASAQRRGFVAAVLVLLTVAWLQDGRTRVLVAGAVAMGLLFMPTAASPSVPSFVDRALASLGRSSYALFLLHFPLLLLGNAAWVALGLHGSAAAVAVALAIWASSLLAGCLFERFVEQPVTRWLNHPRPKTKGATAPLS